MPYPYDCQDVNIRMNRTAEKDVPDGLEGHIVQGRRGPYSAKSRFLMLNREEDVAPFLVMSDWVTNEGTALPASGFQFGEDDRAACGPLIVTAFSLHRLV